MSLAQNTYWELKAYKPHLTLKLGDVVVFREDPKQQEMVISNFLPINYRDRKEDYMCKWVSAQGKPFQNSFKEKDLIKIEQ